MVFDPESYGAGVASILALDGHGRRLMPLEIGGHEVQTARHTLQHHAANDLFSGSRAPDAALSGLWLYFSFFDEAHSIAQDIHTADGSYWHGILHRQEPDAGNAGYWFRRVGRHAIFAALRDEADALVTAAGTKTKFAPGAQWDPFAFTDFCEYARTRAGSVEEHIAQQIQLVEWQLLFDHCARKS
jgi:hypothetical protein